MGGTVAFRKVRTGRRHGGFTIIELLVVVGLATIVISLILAAVSKVRSQSQQVKCASQLHQLGIAIANYAAQNGGWLPAWSGWHVYPPGVSPEDEPGEAWTEQLAPFFVQPDSPLYCCPSFPSRQMTYFITGRWAASVGQHSMRLSDIRLSAQFVLGGEDTNQSQYAPPYGDAFGRTTSDCDQDDANSPCACFPGEPGGFLEHPAGNNILFGDLHVQPLRAFDLNWMTFDPAARRPWSDVSPDN